MQLRKNFYPVEISANGKEPQKKKKNINHLFPERSVQGRQFVFVRSSFDFFIICVVFNLFARQYCSAWQLERYTPLNKNIKKYLSYGEQKIFLPTVKALKRLLKIKGKSVREI